MKTQITLVAFGGGLLVLASCAQTRSYTPPGAGHPASSESPITAFSPPPNPLAASIEPIDDTGGAGSKPGMPGMDGMDGMKHEEPASNGLTIYTCPMHADVRSDHPGDCPKCGMQLVPMKAAPANTHQHGGTP